MQKLIDGMLSLAVIATFGLMLLVLGQSGSPLRARYDHWKLLNDRRAVAQREWQKLVVGGHLGEQGKTIVEFSDYQCPFCRSTEPLLDSLRRAGVVNVAYHHLPLSIHPLARGAALAAICAQDQGAFAQMHHELMSTQDWQRDSNWVALAMRARVADTSKFRACLGSEAARGTLESDANWGAQLHVNGTPTFLTQRTSVDGALHTSDIATLTAGRN